jgi:hypothetical protein
VFGVDNLLSPNAPEDGLDHAVVEEELNLQLDLLNEQLKNENDGYLFPVEDMVELPHLKTTKSHQSSSISESTALSGLLEEGTLESLAFCLLIGAVLAAPQLILN